MVGSGTSAHRHRSRMAYFDNFLSVTPMALALWRCGEAYALDQMMPTWQSPVLDIGCGFGEFMGVFYRSTIEMGIDISQKDLILAAHQKKYRKLQLADARHLPLEDASVQTVVSVSVLEHIPDAELVIREVYRILKPGGTFVYTVPTNLINTNLVGANLLRNLSLRDLADSYVALYHRIYKHKNIWKPEKWLTLTKKTGFTNIVWQPTLSVSQLHAFEAGTLLAIPSQLTRIIGGKRWVVDFDARHTLWKNRMCSYINDRPTIPINIAVTGVKP